MTKKRRKRNSARDEVLVGAPIFGNDPRLRFVAPYGHVDLYQKVRNETQNPQEILLNLSTEYGAILQALVVLGINFRIAFAHSRLIIPGLKGILEKMGLGDRIIQVPDFDTQLVTFPRDVATRLSRDTLLINPDFDHPALARRDKLGRKKRLLTSPYGEGGRVLSRRRTVLLTEKYFPQNPIQMTAAIIQGARAKTEIFERAGMTVGLLPNIVQAERLNDGTKGFEPEDHLDRTSGLLEDKKGGLHLITAPGIHSGWSHPLNPPRIGPERTLARYREVCQNLGIELHVPNQLTIPGSVGFIQFRNGKVLMTTGDDEVAGIVSEIVGRDQLFLTSIPIRYYPVWSNATIRCLIGELPSWFLYFLEK